MSVHVWFYPNRIPKLFCATSSRPHEALQDLLNRGPLNQRSMHGNIPEHALKKGAKKQIILRSNPSQRCTPQQQSNVSPSTSINFMAPFSSGSKSRAQPVPVENRGESAADVDSIPWKQPEGRARHCNTIVVVDFAPFTQSAIWSTQSPKTLDSSAGRAQDCNGFTQSILRPAVRSRVGRIFTLTRCLQTLGHKCQDLASQLGSNGGTERWIAVFGMRWDAYGTRHADFGRMITTIEQQIMEKNMLPSIKFCHLISSSYQQLS
ncbi:uncharacterized protein MYCFIDRAFT_209182 [Pseudocercospora fijiensis CIRAD86]|uniref:Uncharacterized protein n=1 Tax=Pseudocercospora fijiensis (strain CIRAD86) TaxID=383855 RepID=M3AK11_PSEFD|nr:uncharacterized protein MYCFIDRAFT_209182 [Pseudocercospora fijiensis CIRAD86]EME77777.1 hypothetical protein MYCFIDRAFT_209182 [Pseudocercospora fijiensis CIRAD86]